jgi:hypothetical protein
MESLLWQIKEYIEETQEILDAEFGGCREIAELIKTGEMPELYDDILSELLKF